MVCAGSSMDHGIQVPGISLPAATNDGGLEACDVAQKDARSYVTLDRSGAFGLEVVLYFISCTPTSQPNSCTPTSQPNHFDRDICPSEDAMVVLLGQMYSKTCGIRATTFLWCT